MAKVDRVKSGIPGFDKVAGGGFIKNSVNLISGGAGAGKSIFTMQFLYNGITKFKENGVFISFEEDINNLKEDALQFGWDFVKLEKQGKCIFIYIYPYELANFQAQIEKAVNKVKAKRIGIDSTSTFGLALENEYEVRKELYSLAAELKKLNSTSMLTSEIVGEVPIDVTSGSGRYSRFGVEEFVCDSVMTLHNTGLGGASNRAMRIVKMRRSDHVKGPIPMKIGKTGITVLNKEI